jgi:hypothetical protein
MNVGELLTARVRLLFHIMILSRIETEKLCCFLVSCVHPEALPGCKNPSRERRMRARTLAIGLTVIFMCSGWKAEAKDCNLLLQDGLRTYQAADAGFYENGYPLHTTCADGVAR